MMTLIPNTPLPFPIIGPKYCSSLNLSIFQLSEKFRPAIDTDDVRSVLVVKNADGNIILGVKKQFYCMVSSLPANLILRFWKSHCHSSASGLNLNVNYTISLIYHIIFITVAFDCTYIKMESPLGEIAIN